MSTGNVDEFGIGPRIHVPKTSEIVADRIRAQIIRGELSEGDKLPPEGQILESLKISRPTLREAFRILEAEGFISVVRGSRTGAKVHQPSVELVSRYAGYTLQSQGTTIAELYQARLAIEPTVVRWLATSKGKTPGMAHVREVLADLAVILQEERYEDFLNLVEIFHHALVAASGNKVLSFMNRMLLNLARKHQLDFRRRYPRNREERLKAIRVGYRSFDKVVRLIEAGLVEEAVTHWRLHLRNAEATWAGEGEGKRVVDSLGD